jgi:ABC-type multidrug transport system fused ATPase/permease subunit
MFYLSPKLTFLMLSIVPPLAIGVVFYGRYLKRLSNQTQEALGDMSKVAQESLSALRTVQAFNAQPAETDKFSQRVRYVMSLARKEAFASGVFFGVTGWSGNVTLLALLGYGASIPLLPSTDMIDQYFRWLSGCLWNHHGWRSNESFDVHRLCWWRTTNANLLLCKFSV